MSKEQCAITARENDLEVVSLGRNPTGVRLGASDWQQLKGGTSTALSPGDLIAFDWKRRAGTVFVIGRHAGGDGTSSSARWLWQNGPSS